MKHKYIVEYKDGVFGQGVMIEKAKNESDLERILGNEFKLIAKERTISVEYMRLNAFLKLGLLCGTKRCVKISINVKEENQ